MLIDLDKEPEAAEGTLQLTSFNICQSLDPECALGKNLVELDVSNLDTINKMTKVAIEYATSTESSQSRYFVNACELFAEQLRIIKLLNPGTLRKLTLLGKLSDLRVDSNISIEESKEENTNVE